MFRIFTKEKKSKELFNINLTKKEVEELMHDNLFLDFPHIKKEDCIVIEREEPFKNPTFVDGIIREMTKQELVEEGIEVQLGPGEKIENKKIKKPSDKRNWILADNTIREFTYEQLSKILDEKASRKEKLYDKFGALSIQLENSNSVEEIEAIKWE